MPQNAVLRDTQHACTHMNNSFLIFQPIDKRRTMKGHTEQKQKRDELQGHRHTRARYVYGLRFAALLLQARHKHFKLCVVKAVGNVLSARMRVFK